MASIIEPAYAAISQVILAALPDVTGIYEAEHASMIPWENYQVPYAVMLIESLPSTRGNYGATNNVFEVPLKVFYVAEVRGPVSPVRAGLEALMEAFLSGDTCPADLLQVLDVDGLEWGETLETNQIMTDKQLPQRAGCITVSILLGKPYPAP